MRAAERRLRRSCRIRLSCTADLDSTLSSSCLTLSSKLFEHVLNDFVSAVSALENVSLGGWFGRGWAVMLRDPLAVLVYLVMKPILARRLAVIMC